MICRICGEYLEWVDVGADDAGEHYDLYICIECGHEEAVRQTDTQADSREAPRYEWEPPDGSRWRGKRQP